MKHILWVSRHPPTPELMTKLSGIVGDEIIITRHEKSIDTHEDLVKKYREGGYDDIVVTLPLEMIGRICAAGVSPIKAVHKMSGCDPNNNMRTYEFLRFERIFSVSVEKERLEPKQKKSKP